MSEPRACLRCQGPMEPGFIMDHDYSLGAPQQWVEGPPVKSFWTGVKTSGRDVLPVATWRCAKCGYLESYASPTARS
jgi:hypothetical protein